MDTKDPDTDYMGTQPQSSNYALSGKIMLTAVVILFFVIILMICLHLYARWYLLRARRHYLRRRSRNRRPTSMVFYVEPSNVSVHATRGLSASVIKSLPVFTYSIGSTTHPDFNQIPVECAVCLSEFEENESGRILPNCKHSFHVDCIDMWFHSHSTCPLCRSPVEPVVEDEPSADVAVAIPDWGSNSAELCDTCRDGSGEAVSSGSSSSTSSSEEERRRKPAAIEVPIRNAAGNAFDDDSTRSDSPASRSFRSPMSRMLSFTRILSRERRTTVGIPSAGTALASPSPSACASVNESDIEQGREVTHY